MASDFFMAKRSSRVKRETPRLAPEIEGCGIGKIRDGALSQYEKVGSADGTYFDPLSTKLRNNRKIGFRSHSSLSSSERTS